MQDLLVECILQHKSFSKTKNTPALPEPQKICWQKLHPDQELCKHPFTPRANSSVGRPSYCRLHSLLDVTLTSKLYAATPASIVVTSATPLPLTTSLL